MKYHALLGAWVKSRSLLGPPLADDFGKDNMYNCRIEKNWEKKDVIYA